MCQESEYPVVYRLRQAQEALEKAQKFVTSTEEYLKKHGYTL
jgi:hypothetical protein